MSTQTRCQPQPAQRRLREAQHPCIQPLPGEEGKAEEPPSPPHTPTSHPAWLGADTGEGMPPGGHHHDREQPGQGTGSQASPPTSGVELFGVERRRRLTQVMPRRRAFTGRTQKLRSPGENLGAEGQDRSEAGLHAGGSILWNAPLLLASTIHLLLIVLSLSYWSKQLTLLSMGTLVRHPEPHMFEYLISSG